MKPLGIRRRLLMVVIATVAAATAGLLTGFNLLLSHTLDKNTRDVLRSRAAAELATLTATGQGVELQESPRSGPPPDRNAWIFSGSRILEAPRAATPAVTAAARELAAEPKSFRDLHEPDLRLYGVPVRAHGARVGTVVVALSLAPYEQTRKLALGGSLIFGGLLLILVAFAARWLLATSLGQVTRMTRQAAAWSEHDLDHRFGLGLVHDEVTELGASLDELLDRLAASLRREQRFSAELSHELRTPLARLIAETEIALRRDRDPEEYRQALEVVRTNAVQLGRIVDTLVAAARHEAGAPRGTADAYSMVTEAAAACAGLASDRHVDLSVERPLRPIRVGVDPDLGERILQPVLENACRYGSTTVRVQIENAGPAVEYVVRDDGPGVSEEERERIFEPGVRGTASTGNGSGLGLSLARRLAQSVAGEIEAQSDARGGRFLVRLPAG